MDDGGNTREGGMLRGGVNGTEGGGCFGKIECIVWACCPSDGSKHRVALCSLLCHSPVTPITSNGNGMTFF